ncbi:Hypothetical predicted protein, partial [Mytilus galloprovincialis]
MLMTMNEDKEREGNRGNEDDKQTVVTGSHSTDTTNKNIQQKDIVPGKNQTQTKDDRVDKKKDQLSKGRKSDQVVEKTINKEAEPEQPSPPLQIATGVSAEDIQKLIIKVVKKGDYKMKIVPFDLWDFGGQKDYYMTHQLFITNRGVYVVMFNGSIDIYTHLEELGYLPGQYGKPTTA